MARRPRQPRLSLVRYGAPIALARATADDLSPWNVLAYEVELKGRVRPDGSTAELTREMFDEVIANFGRYGSEAPVVVRHADTLGGDPEDADAHAWITELRLGSMKRGEKTVATLEGRFRWVNEATRKKVEAEQLKYGSVTVYPEIVDEETGDEVGAYLMVDMAHYAGLVAAGFYPNPVPFADVVTSTTHKTLRGPRGGVILMKAEHEKALNSAIFPGLQGGPLEHVIAAKAVAFKEAATPGFKQYQEQVINNARVMARVLGEERGLRVVSGRTESHVFLLDLRAKNITGKDAEAALGRAHITVNKNGIPNDPQKPFVTSGIRIGSPAMTTRGFTEIEAERIAHLIADVLDAPNDEAVAATVREKVSALCKKFPVYGA